MQTILTELPDKQKLMGECLTEGDPHEAREEKGLKQEKLVK